MDARLLNEKLANDPVKIENVEVMLQKCSGSQYFTSLDMNSSFWQIPLHPQSQKYTGFLYKSKTYVYTAVPFGLKVSQSGLIRALNEVFDDSVNKHTIIFVDDILCLGTNFDNHISNLEQILKRISDSGMTLNFEKCHFVLKEVKFLGYILNEKGISTDPEKIKAINEYPPIKNCKNLRSFIGHCSFYNRFIKNYSELIAPLLPLTSKKNKWVWTEKEEKQINVIKQKFLETVILIHPNRNKDFYLNTDSSGIGIGGVLYQLSDSGEHEVILFIRRILKPYERNYNIYELDCLAIAHCLK